MVLAPERVEVPVEVEQFDEPQIETTNNSVDPKIVIAFAQAVTGRKIREQQQVDYAGMHSGSVKVFGGSVEHYIAGINDNFRDHPFDVVAGPNYTQVGRIAHRAIQLTVKPGLSEANIALLAVHIPLSVPLTVKVVYKESNLLTPPRPLPGQKYPNRVTHVSERVMPHFVPDKR
jgi:hypothetical protein